MSVRFGAACGAAGLILPLGIVMMLPAAAPPAPEPLPGYTKQTVVCPVGDTGTTVLAAGDGEISTAPVGGAESAVGARVVLSGQTVPVALTSSSGFSHGSLVASGGTLSWSQCLEARTSGLVQFLHPKTSEVLLVNNDDAEAAVDLSIFGPDGEITAGGSRGIALSPRSSRMVPISTLVSDDRPVGVLIQASTGRVAAVGRSQAAAYSDFERPGAPAQRHLIPAVPAAASAVRLLVTNPGDERATFSVSAFSTQRIALADAQRVQIQPGSTMAVDLTTAIAGSPVSLEVSSDLPIMASAVVSGTGDLASATHREPIITGRLITGQGGTLSVTNPSDVQTTVTISSAVGTAADEQLAEVAIAPGQTWSAPAVSGAAEVTYNLRASSPVLAAVTFLGPTGVAIAPFSSMSGPAVVDTVPLYDIGLR